MRQNKIKVKMSSMKLRMSSRCVNPPIWCSEYFVNVILIKDHYPFMQYC